MTVLHRDHEFEFEEWSKDLEAQPFSLAISRQGHRIAVGFEKSTQVFDGATRNFTPLPSAVPERDEEFLIDSQCMSFSVCGNHLVVATREKREGNVYTGVHDLPPLSRRNQRMHNLRIPTVGSNLFYWLYPSLSPL